jgi:hypothetical protein
VTRTVDTERLDLFILAYVGSRSNPPSPSDTLQMIAAIVGDAVTRPALRALVHERLAALADAGLIEKTRRTLTAAGRQRVSRELGVEPGQRWATVKKHIVTRGLGLDPRDRDAIRRTQRADGLRGLLLARALELPTKPPPTLARAKHALCWRAVGVDSDEPFSIEALLKRILAQHLDNGTITPTRLSADKLAGLVAARAVGARSADAQKLRSAVSRRWLLGDPTESLPPEPDPSAAPRQESLREFAARVQAAANREGAPGRFGDRKVFISAVWRRLCTDPSFAALGVDRFKELLGDANREGLLRLHRADLVAAMDPAEVRASEACYLNATFHFVESAPRSYT